MKKNQKKTHFAALKESRTRGLVATRRATVRRLKWLDAQLEVIDPHLLERERIFTEQGDFNGRA